MTVDMTDARGMGEKCGLCPKDKVEKDQYVTAVARLSLHNGTKGVRMYACHRCLIELEATVRQFRKWSVRGGSPYRRRR